MQTGTVKFFKEDAGYGFINTDDGSEIFVHRNNLKPRHCVPQVGQSVTYQEGEYLGRRCAEDVRFVEPSK